MTAAEYIVDFLISRGVTDAFGIPGGVVLEILYAMERRKNEFTPHLAFHEQGSSFAACGYAQTTGKLGVTYATRGPGFTNMITAMADAYYDSIPVLFITAHDSNGKKPGMRIQNNQEMDTVKIVSEITKYAARVDTAEDVPVQLERAYEAAMTGRRGPVFLDFFSPAMRKEVSVTDLKDTEVAVSEAVISAADEIEQRVKTAKRPVILIGSGVKQSCTTQLVEQFAEQSRIPVLSSRMAQDALPGSPMYFGFIGSHALRHSAFILSKADLIIALGNRLAFPVNSQSFRPIVENTTTIRIDADPSEFLREVPNSIPFAADLTALMPELLHRQIGYIDAEDWLSVCRKLKNDLNQWDKESIHEPIMALMERFGPESPITCDVGNHGFWVSYAHAYQEVSNRILYTNSFGSLGCALPKAIGAYYGSRLPVMCFIGDQGVQFNIQELQFIAQHKLPITIVVLNNHSSGMIRKREKELYGENFVHTTFDSGFGVPDLKKIASAYGLAYYKMDNAESAKAFEADSLLPSLVEMEVKEAHDLRPDLPKGHACQNLTPVLPEDLYQDLNKL